MAAVARSGLSIAKLFGVAGKKVLVTGGGRGIGEMIARTYVENGCDVYISSRSAEALEKKASELNALGLGTCTAIPADLSIGKSSRGHGALSAVALDILILKDFPQLEQCTRFCLKF